MSVRILQGDCREVLKSLPDESVHCVVTSPPYFGLRDYGTAKWDGGDPDCDHATFRSTSASTLKNDGRPNPGACEYDKSVIVPYRSKCGKCGAHRIDSQIGLEPTPDAYVAEMVSVFRELRRVLRSDGVCFLNLGDSYAGGGRGGGADGSKQQTNVGSLLGPKSTFGLKPKDLIGIPWRVAFALQADGWWLRQDIIWAKPNPMPESVTDRCTKAHEYLFLLTKSARYYFDAEAIAEETEYPPGSREDVPRGNFGGKHNGEAFRAIRATRNKRSVWSIATQPFSGAHFATFPPALIEPCILAGCPKDGTVLDPFGGAGTTGLVADRLQRNAILVELNPAYAEMAERRIHNDTPLLMEAAE